jgi:hypothetical protein
MVTFGADGEDEAGGEDEAEGDSEKLHQVWCSHIGAVALRDSNSFKQPGWPD